MSLDHMFATAGLLYSLTYPTSVRLRTPADICTKIDYID